MQLSEPPVFPEILNQFTQIKEESEIDDNIH